jgi:streptomycin 6-kinase
MVALTRVPRQPIPDSPLILLKWKVLSGCLTGISQPRDSSGLLAAMNRSPEQTVLSKAMIRWSLSRPVLIAETPTSWIYKVEQTGRDPAVLKQLKPDLADDEELRGSALLAWYAGQGAATVFDAADGVIFMEWLDGPTLGDAARSGHDEEATIALATLVQQLHGPRDADPPPLLPLRLRYQTLFEMSPAKWPAQGRDLLARATGIAHQIFDKPAPAVPLHGDLHHDNVIGSRRGWLAIDPKGLVGDPAYEVANAFRNPFGENRLLADPARIAGMTEIFASRLGYPVKRILAYAATHAALSICWNLQTDNTAEIVETQSVLPLLLAAYDRA